MEQGGRTLRRTSPNEGRGKKGVKEKSLYCSRMLLPRGLSTFGLWEGGLGTPWEAWGGGLGTPP